jgi:DNA-directed RNA polymerase subunit M/transcription elongation factor TFIIS
MPHSSCPDCKSPHVQWLADSSRGAVSDFYRCGDCKHVWHVSKYEPESTPILVTAKR